MFRLKELIERDRAEIAALITQERGKVLHDAAGSVQRGLENVEFACGIPHLIKGEFNDQVGAGVDCYSMRQPLGVCVGITPFNFPAMVPLWMFPLAIACGNAFILKPSEKDPGCSIKWAGLLKEAGLPSWPALASAIAPACTILDSGPGLSYGSVRNRTLHVA